MSELHCDPGFRQLLAQHFSLAELEQSPGTIYGLWPDLTLAYLNPAWFVFARDNQGEPTITARWGLGRVITDALPDVLHPFYVELYLHALENQADTALQHAYECSSPHEYRLFDMQLHNLGSGAGLLIINRQQRCGEHRRIPRQVETQKYQYTTGRYRQCSHCRCYENHQEHNQWDWIPDWIVTPPLPIDYSLCPSCFNHYYSFAS